MNYLVIHEHHWENDRHGKGNPEHSSILCVSKNREDAYMRAEQPVDLARSARANSKYGGGLGHHCEGDRHR